VIQRDGKLIWGGRAMEVFPDGVWPTMITPFMETDRIDYYGLEHLIEWYIRKKATGLFTVCQSSEMFYLTLAERIELAKFVKKQVDGRIPVIASGHVADSLGDQLEEVKRIWATGIDVFVILTNRFAGPDESDDLWMMNVEWLLNKLPEVKFGIYEVPYPYKRLLSPRLLQWCAATGRFLFFKDTSCDIRQIQAKLIAVRGSNLKLFNANSATLLATLQMGASGYSGVMTNFFPDLYVWLVSNWNHYPKKAALVQNMIGTAALVERQCYPVNAKYFLRNQGISIALKTRSRDIREFGATERLEIDQLAEVYRLFKTNVTE
jgi:4-hydroxy-tetrahydrodipicolinate synthase